MAVIAFDTFDFNANDVLYETLPLYHAAGLNLGVLAAISKGRPPWQRVMVRWVDGSIPDGGPIELFIVPANAPRLV